MHVVVAPSVTLVTLLSRPHSVSVPIGREGGGGQTRKEGGGGHVEGQQEGKRGGKGREGGGERGGERWAERGRGVGGCGS